MKEEKEAIERLDYFEPDDLIECAMYRDCVETIKNLIDNQQKEIANLKEIEEQHKIDNGLLRQELDMQIEHNKELDRILHRKMFYR